MTTLGVGRYSETFFQINANTVPGMYDSFPLQRTSGLLILIFLMRQLDLSRPLILFTKLTEGGSLTGSCLFHEFTRTTGSPSSSCEMIILRNKSLGENIRVCMRIFTTALRIKKELSNSQ